MAKNYPKWFIVIDASGDRSEFVKDYGERQKNVGNDVEFLFYDVETMFLNYGEKKNLIHYRNPREVWVEGRKVYPEK